MNIPGKGSPKKLLSTIPKASSTKSVSTPNSSTSPNSVKAQSTKQAKPKTPSGTEFKLTTDDAQSLLKSADGMQPYTDQGSTWEPYPQREANSTQNGIAFNDRFEFQDGIKTETDEKLSFAEKNLAAEQLTWDATLGSESKSVDNPISPENAKNGQTFLSSIFWNHDNTAGGNAAGTMRSGLDADNDNEFTKVDIAMVATYDGNAEDVTSTDFDQAAMREKSPMTEASETLSKIEVAPPQD